MHLDEQQSQWTPVRLNHLHIDRALSDSDRTKWTCDCSVCSLQRPRLPTRNDEIESEVDCFTRINSALDGKEALAYRSSGVEAIG